MGLNHLEFASVFQKTLDKQIVAEATSGWMEENAGQIKYEGGSEVKIPQLSLSGLGNYDRDGGFTKGTVTLKYQTMQMTQDRGRTFQIDAVDVDETNFVAVAGEILGEFQRVRVIPEIDAYRYSTIAKKAVAATRVSNATPTNKDILQALMTDIEKVKDVAGSGAQLVITMSVPAHTLLSMSAEAQKFIDAANFEKGGIYLTTKTLDGNPIIPVSSMLMKTDFIFRDGTTAGEEEGGFIAANDAKEINWIICVRKSPIAVSKTDVARIFDPMTNQNANAWKIDYRKYHDLWLPEHAMEGIWVNMKP